MRKDNPEPREMEEPPILEESNPMFGDILDESQGNFGSIVIKEENISDVEPDDLLRELEDQSPEQNAELEIIPGTPGTPRQYSGNDIAVPSTSGAYRQDLGTDIAVPGTSETYRQDSGSHIAVPGTSDASGQDSGTDIPRPETSGTCGQSSSPNAVVPRTSGTSRQNVGAESLIFGTLNYSVLLAAIKKRAALAALVKREEEWRVKFMPNNSDHIPKCTHDAKYKKVTRKKLKCSECKSSLCPICHCILISTVQNHFSKSDNNNKYYYPCRLCHMLFRSNCALKAHLLIHALDTPYVCPDCGSVYNNIHYLSLHLINKCNHVYKIVKSGCKFCKSPNMAPAEYMAHIEQAHITRIYKCSVCGLMFEVSSDIERHLKNSHRQEKATCRNYFCCSLCGNLIISRDIYGRHMRFHIEFSGAYEICYFCPCNRLFSVAVDFRAHSEVCGQKGVLPPHWTYLKVTLRPNEMLHLQNDIENRVLLDSDDTGTDGNSSDELERLFEDGVSSTSFSDASTNHTGADQSHGTEDDTRSSYSGITFRDFIRNTPGVIIRADESGNKFIVQRRSGRSVFNRCERYEFVEKCSTSSGAAPSIQEEKDTSDVDDNEAVVSPSVANDQCFEEISEFQDENISPSEQENENEYIEMEGEDVEYNVEEIYDVDVPEDQYDYLSAEQHEELNEDMANTLEEPPQNAPKTAETAAPTPGPSHGEIETDSESNSILVTSVLGQLSGVMKRMKRRERRRRKLLRSGMNTGQDSDSQSGDAQSRNSTFFSCPFCTVLFPKHTSSFQKFRLHMEVYHQDACIDIDADLSDTPKSQMQYTSIPVSDDSENDSSDLDDLDLQTRFEILEGDEEDDVSYLSSSSINSGNHLRKPKKLTWRKERLLANRNRGNQARKCDAKKKGQNNEDKDDEEIQSNENKQNEHANRNGASKKTNKSGRNSKRSKNRRKRHAAKKKINENAASQEKPPLLQNIVESENSDSSGEKSLKLNSPERDVADTAPIEDVACASNSREPEDEENSESSISKDTDGKLELTENHIVEEDKIDGNESTEESGTSYRNQVGILNHRSVTANDDEVVRDAPENESEEEARNEGGQRNGSEPEHDSASSCSKDTLDKEPYSPESSKTSTTEMDNELQNAENLNETDDREEVSGHSTERKDPQEEGDLWEEFYNSLNIAGRRNKTKETKPGKSGKKEPSKKKRVVEKPRRYRGTSNTEQSEDEKRSPSSLKSDDNENGQNDDNEANIETGSVIRYEEHVDDGFVSVGVVSDHDEDRESHDAAAKTTDGTSQNSDEGKETGEESEPVKESGIEDNQGVDDEKDNEEEGEKVKKVKNKGNKDKNKDKKNKDKKNKDKKDNDKKGKDKNDKDQDKNDKDQDKKDKGQEKKDKDQDKKDKDQDKKDEDQGKKDKDEGKKDKDRDEDDKDDDENDKDKDEKKKERNKKEKDMKKDEDENKDDKDEDNVDKNEKEKKNDGKKKEKVINKVNVNEVGRQIDAEVKNGERKRPRRKMTEPLSTRELRRADLRGATNSADRNSESDSSEFSACKKKRRVTPRTKRVSTSPERNEFSSGQVITTRSHGAEKKLTCVVCKETLPNKQEFRDHIQSHRVDDNNYQCMECGECFVVRPSLEKHLHAYHKVKDVKKYIEENGCSAAEATEESDTEPLKENQCKVCRDEFDTLQDLNKHFRIHGMAFLEQVKREARAHHHTK